MTIEEALRTIAGRAAVLRYLADAAALNDESIDAAVLNGVSDLAEDIGELLQRIKVRLDPDTLNRELARRR